MAQLNGDAGLGQDSEDERPQGIDADRYAELFQRRRDFLVPTVLRGNADLRYGLPRRTVGTSKTHISKK